MSVRNAVSSSGVSECAQRGQSGFKGNSTVQKNTRALVSLHSQIDASEGKDIAGHFTDGATKAQESGILVNQIKYYFVRVDEQNGDKFRLIIGKKGATGVTIYKTEQGG